MRMNGCRSLAIFTLVALAYPACGQSVVIPATPAKPNCNCVPHDRQPYTAEFKITSVQTLADGTIITRESTETDAVGSQGRHMHALTDTTPQLGRAPGTFVNANDPVDGTQSTWDSRTKKARVIKLPPQDERHGCWANDSGNFRMSWPDGPRPIPPASSVSGAAAGEVGAMIPAKLPKPEIVDLGTSAIDGLEAHGRRFTTTIQAGEMGNDEPIVTTREVWTSTEMQWPVREVTNDPRSGKRTRELVDFTQSEPDPTTFQPPEGYDVTIVELHKVECAAAQ
jgi:hypothetical protein